ncbi:unnamed protein product [Brassicogethes aeneus]|uniref:Integrin alpha second immunoglobulin-like domain-containing protein n=1 Tax=Brassicogethes aeneus TaxID=1431903 RepID=A0A9P0AWR8_BRAAE|nr:unnamed protein product [Brassicogethes aeneus]
MLILVCLFAIILKTTAFNLDLYNAVIFEDPKMEANGKSESYFGFSVALTNHLKNKTGSIFIGAPKQTNPNPKIEKSGVMYKCSFTQNCTTLDFPLDSFKSKFVAMQNAFIGGSADINSNNELLITSASYSYYYHDKPNYYIKGILFLTNLTNEKTSTIYPFEKERNIEEVGGIQTAVYGRAQAGFSVHFPKNDHDSLMLGSPGYLAGRGTAVKTNLNNGTYIVPSLGDNYSFFTGYSVSSGNFFKNDTTNYVVSALLVNDAYGKIKIFDFPPKSTKPEDDPGIPGNRIKKGTQRGAGFGYCIATGDIDGDHLDDIVVGAPFYKTKTFNEGAVYVFLGSTTGSLKNPKEGSLIERQHSNGQFGMSVMFLNDINADGFGDVAVAAPFQDDGVVYLYHGSKNGLKTTSAQIIEGKSLKPGLRGFGFSMSKPCDVDNNKASDLAIGSFLSGHAVYLRGRPVVVVTTSFETYPPFLDKQAKHFNITLKYSVENKHNPKQANSKISLTRIIDLDGTSFKPPPKKIDVIIGKPQYENITIKMSNVNKNYVEVKLTYVFADAQKKNNRPSKMLIKNGDTRNFSGGDTFCPSCPVIDVERSSGPITINISLNLECGSVGICNSDLSLELKLLDLFNDTYITGTKSNVRLEVIIKNAGDYAYSNDIIVKLPKQLSFSNKMYECSPVQSETEAIKCPVININKGETEMVKFDLDLAEVNNGYYSEPLLITVDLKTKSENVNKNLTKEISMRLHRDADIYLDGSSEKPLYEFSKDGSTNFTQVYRVGLDGISSIEQIQVKIKMPFYFTVDKTIQFAYLVDIPDECEKTAKNIPKKNEKVKPDWLSELKSSKVISLNSSLKFIESKEIICTLGPFNENVKDRNIKFLMQINENAVKGVLGKKMSQIKFETYGEANIVPHGVFKESGNRSNSFTVSTLFVYKMESKIPFWYIIAAVVAGTLVLLVIVVVLVKIGFFKRKMKVELDKRKEELCQNENVNDLKENNEDHFHTLPEGLANSASYILDDDVIVEECST